MERVVFYLTKFKGFNLFDKQAHMFLIIRVCRVALQNECVVVVIIDHKIRLFIYLIYVKTSASENECCDKSTASSGTNGGQVRVFHCQSLCLILISARDYSLNNFQFSVCHLSISFSSSHDCILCYKTAMNTNQSVLFTLVPSWFCK